MIIKQKTLQLACKQLRYGSTNIFRCSSYGAKSMYLQIMSSWYCACFMKKGFVHTCHIKGFSCSNYKVKVNTNIVPYNRNHPRKKCFTNFTNLEAFANVFLHFLSRPEFLYMRLPKSRKFSRELQQRRQIVKLFFRG